MGLASGSLKAQIVAFSFNGAAGNEAIFDPDAQPAGAAVNGMIRGTGINPSASAGTFSASSWSASGLDPADYFSFSITPHAGMSLALTQLVLDERRSNTGIRDWSIRSSVDSFTQDLGTFHVPDDSLTRANQSIWFGGEFLDLRDTVEFRIYGYASESASGTWRIDNVELYGGITPVPEPSFSGLAAGMGLVGWLLASRLWKILSSRMAGIGTIGIGIAARLPGGALAQADPPAVANSKVPIAQDCSPGLQPLPNSFIRKRDRQ